MTWTHFWDMHSGGSLKTDYHHIYVQLPRAEAIDWFENRFERDPTWITCDCCGQDFAIDEKPTLKQATGYQRNCRNLKTPRDENGRFMNDLPEIQNNYYLEPDEEPPEGFEVDPKDPIGEHVPLDEYVEQDDVLVVETVDQERGASDE
jgi:hypothetical protein